MRQPHMTGRQRQRSTITGTAATDVDSASLTYTLVQQAAHGSVTLHADGTYSYTPNADYNGADGFTFKASDGLLDSNVATISLTIVPVNDAPIAHDGSVAGNAGRPSTNVPRRRRAATALPVCSPGGAWHAAFSTPRVALPLTPDAGYSGS